MERIGRVIHWTIVVAEEKDDSRTQVLGQPAAALNIRFGIEHNESSMAENKTVEIPPED